MGKILFEKYLKKGFFISHLKYYPMIIEYLDFWSKEELKEIIRKLFLQFKEIGLPILTSFIKFLDTEHGETKAPM